MSFNKNIVERYAIIISAVLSTCAFANGHTEVQLSCDYRLTWMVGGSDNGTIDLKIQVNGTGWVGLGITNRNGANMQGADFLIGGKFPNGTTYCSDYHGDPSDKTVPPKIDRIQNWENCTVTEAGGVTTIEVRRLLKTNDTTEDVEIKGNTTQFLLWSYNQNSDDTNTEHTHKYSRALNLVTFSPADAPALDCDSSASSMTIGIYTLLLGLIITAFKTCI